MEKFRIRPVSSGKGVRMSYARTRDVLEVPNLIEIQKNSYQWFLDEGLKEVFADISPISDFSGHLRLEFLDFKLCRDDVKYSIEECKERDATLAAPLKVKVRLINKDSEEILVPVQEIYMGDLPLMTDTGSFVINGAERVIVSQLVRSPGIYYGITRDKLGKKLYSCTVIPNRGAWLEYETDSNDVFYVRVDRTRKMPVTILIRALGVGTRAEILDLFGEDPMLLASFEKEHTEKGVEKDGIEQGAANNDNSDFGLQELYKKIRPGEPAYADTARTHLNSMFFDARRYDLAKVGRYKFNKKLHFRGRITGHRLAEDVVDLETGEVLAEAGTVITREMATDFQNRPVPAVTVEGEERPVRVLSNLMVDLKAHVDCDPLELGIREDVYYPELKKLMDEFQDPEELKEAISKNVSLLIPKHITREDIFASISYCLHLVNGVGNADDIDHLGNRRIRAVGELLQNQYRIGLSRMERVVRERMTTQDQENITPQSLINIKPVTAAVKEFFGSSQLSQFMDQNNPLSELTHKRRLSALGPGGLSRDRAGFEVRDVHYTHYGRMCPIETPEGPNIGLINSLATYARINEYGFVEAPYRVVDKSDPKNPRVTDEVNFMTADEEDNYIVAQANSPLDEDGYFIRQNVAGRFKEETSEFDKSRIDYMDVSPKMVFSVATSMIPFLENDDANRALMGSNMQRQAVPLMKTDSAVVGTGMEAKAAVDSGVCVVAKYDGVVEKVSATTITVRREENGILDTYHLTKFMRSNQSNCYNQHPIVDKGQSVKAGEVLADGPSTYMGEIGLGKNPLIGFMTWEGYNYEDAVLLSERLVQDDVYTSIHIEEYEAEARDTKLGPEEITRDVPGVGEDSLKDLDDRGIIRIGAEVRAGDILVGKVTPKGETELTAEERLLRAIFGEKAREVRDTSLKVPHGAYGIIIDAKVFTRENGDDLSPGVNESVRIYIAQKRKISVGDKMAGRHGNKGVVSRVLPVEDMPYLPNGRPLDIVLNPLGVPSRMNIGQVKETHLSLASAALGFKVTTPVFDGAKETDIGDTLELANDYVNTEWEDFYAKYKDALDPAVMDYLGSHLEHRKLWKGVPITREGKVQLRDGRTGENFDSEVTIGHMNYLKLHHLVDDKIHARSTGPYSLVTQQPLGGKAQFGGQRFGEMEVWALEAYGAAYTLQEILTVKSDDVVGRVKTYEAIIKGGNIPTPGVPESFKVMLKELQALGLDVKLLDENGDEVEVKENVDMMARDFRSVEGDRDYSRREEDFGSYGFQTQEFRNGELADVEPDTPADDDMDEEADDMLLNSQEEPTDEMFDSLEDEGPLEDDGDLLDQLDPDGFDDHGDDVFGDDDLSEMVGITGTNDSDYDN